MGKADAIDCSGDEVFTQQSGADECDINKIIERAKRGAQINVSERTPMYGDFTQVPTDLRDCLNVVRKANEAFMALDAHVRKRFDNDPAKLLDFVNDSKNRDEAIALGIVVAPPVEPVDPALEEIKGLRKDLKESSGAKKSKRSDDE
ncbi:MAG: internal scaffolding protein [Microvirus sp.]|nr:MAG: internal scaffolding protein [Microvirus sp.]